MDNFHPVGTESRDTLISKRVIATPFHSQNVENRPLHLCEYDRGLGVGAKKENVLCCGIDKQRYDH